MEQTGLLDIEYPIYMFTLKFFYLRRVNCGLSEWMVSFNDHPIETERNWSPNQMWLNRMMNPCLPLAVGNLDDDSEDLTFYGEHPEGQTRLEESDDNVEVLPAQLSNINNDELATQISNSIDPFQESSSFGIYICTESLQIGVQKLGQYNLY